MRDAATLSGLPHTVLQDAISCRQLEARRIAGHVLIGYASLKRFLGIPDDVVLDWVGDARVLRVVPRTIPLEADRSPGASDAGETA
jgi:hypothetical protein